MVRKRSGVSQLNHQDNTLVNFISSLPLEVWVYAVADSDSMEPIIPVGSTIRIVRKPFTAICNGSIIAYAINKRRRIIVHRTVKKIWNDGKAVWITKGDNVPSPDSYFVTGSDFIGIAYPMS